MMEGRYRDVVTDDAGRVSVDTGWRRNVIVRSAWPLVAALLRNDSAMPGLQFCAVGEGEPGWDGARPLADASTSRLRAELQRVPLGPDDFAYLDIRGARAGHPTERLEISARFAFPQGRVVLREFGLFGGAASRGRDSGTLVNYVIHEAVALAPNQALTRRVRLSLRPGAGDGPDLMSLPHHWLERESPRIIDGVGEASLAALEAAQIATLGELAIVIPATLAGRIPVTKAIELRAKARLALRTAARIPLVAGVDGMEVQRVMEVDAPTLAEQANVPIEDAEGMQERLGLIQLALDARRIRRMTVAQLRG